MITPESYFRRKLREAPKDAPLDVYVNSPGGSVFAASEMVNAVREWKAETGQRVNVTIGAMAASAASAFTIMAADSVKAHKNAKMMFHGAWTMSIGGKEIHEDTADLLGKINAEIQTRLVTKYNLAPETVAEWFAEGRQGWLTAENMTTAGIISETIEDPSDVIDFPTDAITDIEQRGIGIAALLQTNVDTVKQEEEADASDDSGADVEASDGSGEGEDGADSGDQGEPADGSADGDGAAGIEAPTEEVEALRQQVNIAADAVIDARLKTDALQIKLDASVTEARKLQGERDQARAQSNKLQTALDEATAKVTRLLSGGLTYQPTVETWDQAKAAVAKTGMDAAAIYEAARKQYPDAYRNQRELDKANRK